MYISFLSGLYAQRCYPCLNRMNERFMQLSRECCHLFRCSLTTIIPRKNRKKAPPCVYAYNNHLDLRHVPSLFSPVARERIREKRN